MMNRTKYYFYKFLGMLFAAFFSTLISANTDAKIFVPQKNKNVSAEIYHTVKKGETLFSISKKYKVTPAEIKKWNKLKANNIVVRQKLVVGYSKKKKTEAKTKPPRIIKPLPEHKKAKPLPPEKKVEPKINYERRQEWTDAPMKNVSEVGTASWIDDDTEGKYYALHRTAPVGTIIKVTNSANKKSVYVKVVGKIPTKEEFNVVLIQLSRSASDKLEVSEARFNAELNYAVPE